MVRYLPLGKPFIELLVAVEKSRHDEMQKGPQLGHAVLYGCSRQKEPISTVETEQGLPTLAATIQPHTQSGFLSSVQ